MTDPGGAAPIPGPSGSTSPVDLARQPDFTLGSTKVRPSIAEVVAGGQTVRLQRRVMQVLVALVRANGEVVSRDDLVASCWGGLAVGDDAINRCIGRLRRLAEEEAPGAFAIETLPRIGYRLTPAGAVVVAGPARAVRPPTPAWRLWIVAAATAILALVVAAPRVCTAVGASCPLPSFTSAAVAANSIAVLPFANLSGDPGQEYFSDGLSEELLSRLARIPKLQVAARTSSFSFKGAKADSRTIAAKLGVAYILDGSVRREGDHIRVTAQLVEASTGFERWSQTYDREFKDVFTVQSDIADAVGQALSIQLTGADKAALDEGGTSNPQAYDDYLRGRRFFDSSGGETSQRDALAQFDAAIAADPRFATAYSARARTLLKLANQFLPASQLTATYAAAIASARRAVELAPDLAEAQATLADSLIYGTRDYAAAKLAYDRALLAGGAGRAEVLLRYGQFQCESGDTQEGLIALRRAVVLDPLNARAFSALGRGLLYARQYPEAETAWRRALELSPGISGARAGIGQALLLMDRPAEAEAQFALEPESWQRLTGQAIVFRRLGRTADAQAALKALIADGGDANSYQIAEIHAQWGEPDAAFTALDTAFKIGDQGVELLKIDPLMDPLHKYPDFAKSVARVGFTR
jgi:serine/threonine-protein kinase